MENTTTLSMHQKFNSKSEFPEVGEPNTIYIDREQCKYFIWQDNQYLDNTPKFIINKDQDSVDIKKARQLLDDIKTRDNMIYSLLVKQSVKENYFIPFLVVISFVAGVFLGYHLKLY